MALRILRPTSAGQRGMTTQDFSDITAKRNIKGLLKIKRSKAGRNHQGKITVRHRGAGRKRFYRYISIALPEGFIGRVKSIEYDPNRSARIALVESEIGSPRYIIAQQGMKVGQVIQSSATASIESGNRLPLNAIPAGTEISAIEITPGSGAKLVRSAGAAARLMAKENGNAQIRLPSGEIRMVSLECTATIGLIGNEKHQNINYGKAGRKRRMGIRPSVRGVAMNAVDHPHGGGEGSNSPQKDPRTPWGQKTMGLKTRRRKSTNKYIIKSRHVAKRG